MFLLKKSDNDNESYTSSTDERSNHDDQTSPKTSSVFDKSPLYEGSDFTVGDLELVMAIFKISKKFAESYVTVILKVIKMFLPKGNKCPKTLNRIYLLSIKQLKINPF